MPLPPYQPMPPAAGPIGQVRRTGICILLFFVTLGIYSLFWYFMVHEDMKRHTREGIGGIVALILALFVGIVMPYLSSHEAGQLYQRRGQPQPVTGLTGLWFFPGMLIIIGPFVWFIKTNEAINAYWRSLGGQ